MAVRIRAMVRVSVYLLTNLQMMDQRVIFAIVMAAIMVIIVLKQMVNTIQVWTLVTRRQHYIN
jgi:hypothetical protein